MTKQSLFIFSICSGILLSSCSGEDKHTASFRKYLDQTFGMPIGKDRRYYVLVPASQCPNCILFRGKNLSGNLPENTYVISGLDSSHFPGFRHYYYDKANYITKLPLVDYSNQILLTEGGAVKGIFLMYDLYKQLDSLEAGKQH